MDLAWRGMVEVTGRDRVRFLNGMCTNDVKALKPGQGCMAAVVNRQGKRVAGLEHIAISYTKGCYIGQEVGHVTSAATGRAPGYVRKEQKADGTAVTIAPGLAAVVRSLPWHARETN